MIWLKQNQHGMLKAMLIIMMFPPHSPRVETHTAGWEMAVQIRSHWVPIAPFPFGFASRVPLPSKFGEGPTPSRLRANYWGTVLGLKDPTLPKESHRCTARVDPEDLQEDMCWKYSKVPAIVFVALLRGPRILWKQSSAYCR